MNRHLARSVSRAGAVFVATALALFVSFVLGHELLQERLPGDAAMHVGYATWLNQYFPSVPHWYPLQGGGESLLHGYPVLPHLIVVGLHRLSGLSIYQAFSLLSFVLYPIAALGFYLFGSAVLRSRMAGLIASILYLLSPVSWTWMYDWGFFAQHVGQAILPYCLLALRSTLHFEQVDQRGGMRRLATLAAAVLTVIATLSHMLIGVAALFGMVAYAVARSIVVPRPRKASAARGGLKVVILVTMLVTLVGAAYFIPFVKYGEVANRDGLNTISPALMPRIRIESLSGVEPIDELEIISRMQFSLPIAALALLGGFLAFLRKRHGEEPRENVLAWALVLCFAVIYVVSPGLVTAIYEVSPTVARLVSFRSMLILATLLAPVLAAYSCLSIPSVTMEWLRRRLPIRDGKWHSTSFGEASTRLAQAAFSIGIVFTSLAIFPTVEEGDRWLHNLGPRKFDTRDLWNVRADDPCSTGAQTTEDIASALCALPEARRAINISEFGMGCAALLREGTELPLLCETASPTAADVVSFETMCSEGEGKARYPEVCSAINKPLVAQLLPAEWPRPDLHTGNPITQGHQVLNELFAGEAQRIDLSPHLGRLAQDQAIYTGASQIPSYTNQLSLNHLLWGFEIERVFLDDSGDSRAISEFADWFGLQYVAIDPSLDRAENFTQAGWESVYANDRLQVLKNKTPEPLASVVTQPVVLVLGGGDSSIYRDLFKDAVDGLLPFDRTVLVEGDRKVDEYPLDELLRFDGLLLHGYGYNDSSRAWSNLEQYAASGGSIFVDTGWQFQVPEWEFSEAPEVLPVASLSWESFDVPPSYRLDAGITIGAVDVGQFDPLIWEGGPWGVSAAQSDQVRSWGRIVLEGDDKPLIVAGEYGAGRIVWSGMNYITHMNAYRNSEEERLLGSIFDWLFKGQREQIPPPVVSRSHPDSVTFSVSAPAGNSLWLYWRESYYPNWHAELRTTEGVEQLPVYRAGPGMMLIRVDSPSRDAVVTLTWKLSASDIAGWIATAVGGLMLAGLLLDGLLMDGKGLTWLKIAIVTSAPRPFLGAETTREWVGQKRQQTSDGAFSQGQLRYSPSEAVPWMHVGDGPGSAAGMESSAEGQQGAEDGEARGGLPREAEHRRRLTSDVDPGRITDQEELLRAWLDEAGHREDEWAAKLLANKKKPNGDQ